MYVVPCQIIPRVLSEVLEKPKAILFLVLLGAKEKIIIVSFLEDSSVLTAVGNVGSVAVYKVASTHPYCPRK